MYAMKKGGAYDRFRLMLEAFLERRWEVHCLSLVPIEILHPCYHNHVPGLPFRSGSGWLAKLLVLSFFPFYSLWVGWQQRIDLFIAFGSLYAFLQAIPKWVLKKPMVTLIRGDSSFGLRSQGISNFFLWLNRLIEYAGIISSNRIITVNTAMGKEISSRLPGWKAMDVEVLFNNIPFTETPESTDLSKTRSEFGVSKNGKVIVTAGILNKGKNMEILIKCLQKIGREDLLLLIVGDGTTKADAAYQSYLKELTEALGLAGKVTFTGWVNKEDLWKIFQAADLFVLPSRSEGMPNVLLEALGLDLPCFGSRVPGIADILQYDELMFDPLDEELLADKVRRWLSDIEYAQHIKRLCQNRKKAFLFDWKEKVFQILTEGKPSSSTRVESG